MRFKNFLNWSLILSVCLMSMGCSQTMAIDCLQINPGVLHKLDFSSLKQADAKSWVATQFNISEKDITKVEYHTEPSSYKWGVNQLGFELFFRNDQRKAIWITFNNSAKGITWNEVSSCYGQPEFVVTWSNQDVESKKYSILLIYQKEGLIISANYFTNSNIALKLRDFTFDGISIAPQKLSLEKLIPTAFGEFFTDPAKSHIISLAVKWEGENMNFDFKKL